MNNDTQQKIDAVLAGIIDSRTQVSLLELDAVSRIRISESRKSIQIFPKKIGNHTGCPACVGFSAAFNDTLEKELVEAFSKAFPGYRVTLAD